MLRSFIALSWNIDYSFICNAIGFKSPKAKLFQQKVYKLPKCMDTYNARRPAKLREYARAFVPWCRSNNVTPSAGQFEIIYRTRLAVNVSKLLLKLTK